MNKVSDILKRKGNSFIAVSPNTTVLEALKLMAENNIGSVIVQENDRFMGIMTERDYSRKVILVGKNSTDTKVSEIMTSDEFKVKPEDSVDYCMDVMTNSNIRYLPVFENEKLAGIISMTDVVKETILKQEQTINHLNNYIHS